MIVGTGIDIVEIERIKQMMEKHQQRFLKKTFTEAEIQIGNNKGAASEQYYAGRWAAKEAAVKALGCGFGKDCGFLDIETLNDERGKPILKFSENIASLLQTLKVQHSHISISHEQHYAVATVTLET